MTPAARIQASIEILDAILEGAPVEKALTGWARRSRFAGSKDRAAIRDHVFDALRCKRSFAALGGAETGRGLMIGAARSRGDDTSALFSGERHAPAPVSVAENGRNFDSEAEELDIPDWLWPEFKSSLKDGATEAARALQSRAPIQLRVNTVKTDRAGAIDALLEDGITARPHTISETALQVFEGARRISGSRAYTSGLVELQDAASQAITDLLPLRSGIRVLDYCCGGGGKALAMAARHGVEVFAHDINPARMKDLPARAERAGVKVTILDPHAVEAHAPFDLVLTDAPCSGSGSWRRAPAGKWALTPDRLQELGEIQTEILQKAAPLVAENGAIAYATCSVLNTENGDVVKRFLDINEDWHEVNQRSWTVSSQSDGFYVALLARNHKK